ncbi:MULTISPECIES: recombinase RecA [unclassified Granulicatella]|uniref:recombinase RecA n=1 Tax=unclassified Granulicatella TaxID=2630493 RepID=UPI001074873D|nr:MULTISPECIES: recombinase RecA [unclassified Granulicatella]MBF0779914.1 recombinase RecA [Granulicatella sp. 19428wC4_WM01]TFU96025.1 recombinase RecA [Granulicatella sp. WM01]
MAISDERMKALEKALKEIEKEFGKGSVMRLGDRADTKIDAVSSGSILIDSALGIGGFPRGRIIEIYGPESSGKTTTALHLVAEVQKNGGVAAYIDAEHAMDPVYAKNLGIAIDDLFLSQPDSGEEALEIAESLISSGAIDVIVIDSVAALVPKAEINGLMGEAHVGLQARLMSQALRKLSSVISKTKTIAVFINQLREKVGVSYGSPEVTPGGRALKFYSTIRMDVRKGEAIKTSKDSEVIGNSTKIKIVKNKVAPPFKVVNVDIMYGEGISKTGEVIDLGVEHGFIKKSGSWYSYGETRIGQGRETAKKYLLDHPEVFSELDRKIRIALGIVEPTEEEAKNLADANNTEEVTLDTIDDTIIADLLNEED